MDEDAVEKTMPVFYDIRSSETILPEKDSLDVREESSIVVGAVKRCRSAFGDGILMSDVRHVMCAGFCTEGY